MLAILTTHPIQYQVPLWQALARDGRVPFAVWYFTDFGAQSSHDQEFGKSFAWDLDMLSGYPHQFLDVVPGATPNTFWQCRFRESLADRLRDSQANALWVQGWQVAAYWQAVWAAKRAGVEVWLRAESNDLAPVPLWKRGMKRMLLGQFFRRVDRFLCIGTANRRLYQEYGVREDRLYSTPYGVDNERFARQAEAFRAQRSELRREWSIANDAFCVLFCGKFISKKRPMDLVKAARLLLGDGRLPNVHLLFVGSGELGGELRSGCRVMFDAEQSGTAIKRTSGLSVLPPATFAGFLNQTEISQAYVAADCLVLPSDYGETWGLVVNEAMASGLPCVISDHCGSSVDLGSLAPNLTFPCGDIDALGKRLAQMAKRIPGPVTSPPCFSETLGTIQRLCSNLGICRQNLSSVEC